MAREIRHWARAVWVRRTLEISDVSERGRIKIGFIWGLGAAREKAGQGERTTTLTPEICN